MSSMFPEYDVDTMQYNLQRDVNRLMGRTNFGGRGQNDDMFAPMFQPSGGMLMPGQDDNQQMMRSGVQHQQQQQGSSALVPSLGAGGMMRTTQAKLNVEDQEKQFLVTAELPGFDRENCTVSVNDGVLTICGEQKKEHIEESKKRNYLRTERSFSNISRSVQLPKNVDCNAISAEMLNGVMHISIPKVDADVKRQHILIK